MPIYEYSCPSCDTKHEIVQSMTDDSITVCPTCGQSGLRKLFTGVGVVFKGSGFYRNDSREGKKSSGSDIKKSSGSETKAPASSPTTSASTSGAGSSGSSGTSGSSGSSGAAKPAAG